MSARHVVIVCGYVFHRASDSEDYLDRVAVFCNRKNPDTIVFSGSYTQRKSAPDKSEADAMREYVLPRLTYQPRRVLLETDSHTTPDNIEYTAQILRDHELLGEETVLTVFCEATRALKVDLLVRRFIGRRANLETASWESISPQKQILSTLYAWGVTLCPLLGRLWRSVRIKYAAQV